MLRTLHGRETRHKPGSGVERLDLPGIQADAWVCRGRGGGGGGRKQVNVNFANYIKLNLPNNIFLNLVAF